LLRRIIRFKILQTSNMSQRKITKRASSEATSLRVKVARSADVLPEGSIALSVDVLPEGSIAHSVDVLPEGSILQPESLIAPDSSEAKLLFSPGRYLVY